MNLKTWAAALLGVAIAGYAALCGLLYWKQAQLIYYPQYTRDDARDTNFVLHRDGLDLRGFVVNPGRRDALVYFGGNAETLAPLRDYAARWFPSRTVYLLPYRGYGGNAGVPGEADVVADAVALFDDVRSRHAGGIAVVGRSLGSGVASQVAARRDVERLVLVTPFDSLAEVARGHYPWVPVPWLLSDRYDSAEALRDRHIPILVIRAGRDDVVPPARTDALLRAIPQAEVIDLPHADHINISDDPRYTQALVGFLDQGAAQNSDSSR